jgi:hypothetical protein
MQQAVRDALIAFMAATALARPKRPRPPSGSVSSTRRFRQGERAYLGRKPSYTRARKAITFDCVTLDLTQSAYRHRPF